MTKEELLNALAPYLGTPRTPPTKEQDDYFYRLIYELKRVDDDTARAFFIEVSKLAKNAPAVMNAESAVIESREGVYTYITTGITDARITTPDAFTVYHNAVQNAVGSLIDRLTADGRPTVITAEQIYREINGLTAGAAVKPKAVKDIDNLLPILRNLWVTIDRTEELRKFKKLSGKEALIEEVAVIPYNRTATITNRNGRKVKGYVFNELPPIYRYSKDLQQIHRLTNTVINIDNLHSSPQITALKLWLLQQIESMRGEKKRRNNTINIANMFDELQNDIKTDTESDNLNRKNRKIYTDYMRHMLEYWKNINYIEGYRENKRGRVLISITIEVEK